MRAIRNWSIKTKLVMLSVVSVAVALALSCVGVTVSEIHAMRSFKMESLRAQAGMLAFNCTGVLSFGDPSAGKQLLVTLESQPAIESACLYDSRGKVVATYARPGASGGRGSETPGAEGEGRSGATPAQAPPAASDLPPPNSEVCRFVSGGDVEVFFPVVDRKEYVGTLYLRANADDVRERLREYAKIVLVVALAALGVSFLLASRLQWTISKPLQNLAETATKITSLGDYSIRVPQQSEDELGVLCREFNRMLSRVEDSDKALKAAHDELEDRVAQRTAELRESELRLRTILDAMPIGTLFIDADTHLIVDANPIACEMAGAPKEQIVGNICHRFVCPAQRGQCPISDLGQKVDNAERVLLKADGEKLPVLKTVVPLSIGGQRLLLESFVDISVRKRAEEALAASETRYRLLAENMRDVVWTVDMTMRRTYVSSSITLLTGHTVEEALALPFDEVLTPDSAKQTRQTFVKLLTQAKEDPKVLLQPVCLEMEYRCKNGGTIWTEANMSFLLDKDGSPVGGIGASRDITARRKAAQELHEYARKLEQANHELEEANVAAEAANKAKSRFLANMSHEIRTPLGAIVGFTDLLRKGADQGNETERMDYLDTIHTSGAHLLSLINDILDLSKIEAERLEIEHVRCSPHAIIGEVISVLRARALEKGLSLDFRWESGVPETICTDPARFRQLLINLAGNAIKFTARGGVEIVAELLAEKDNPRLAIQVIDTGVGIAADKFEAIFDPFVQADTSVTRRFGGTGLGLTISRRIAQALGGDIGVSSDVGKGTTFTATIATGPLEGVAILESPGADGMRCAGGREQKEAAPSLAGTRVLLVEDGDTNRKLIGIVLRRAGAEVTMAENGRIGADLAMEHPFDLILMDMQMPVMDGYAATTWLRQQGLTIPIIALTAHAMKGDEEQCRAAGCTGYVTKPIDVDELLRTVAAMAGTGTVGWGASPSSHRPPLLGLAPQPTALMPQPTSPPPLAPLAPSPQPLVSTLPTEDPEFREIVVEFVERLGEQLAAMKGAQEGKDYEELARLAHWLKGAGGTAGFPTFTEPARHLESLVKDRQCDEIEAAVAELLELAQRISLAPGGGDGSTASNPTTDAARTAGDFAG